MIKYAIKHTVYMVFIKTRLVFRYNFMFTAYRLVMTRRIVYYVRFASINNFSQFEFADQKSVDYAHPCMAARISAIWDEDQLTTIGSDMCFGQLTAKHSIVVLLVS